MKNIKTYSEVIRLPTFAERFRYLKIGGVVGKETFGKDRHLNQTLYWSDEWREFRRKVIIRDNGCDLASEGYDIYDKIIVHHINPITPKDILNRDPKIFDLENVICVSFNTHQAIHYGDESILTTLPPERFEFDTCPWKRITQGG